MNDSFIELTEAIEELVSAEEDCEILSSSVDTRGPAPKYTAHATIGGKEYMILIQPTDL